MGDRALYRIAVLIPCYNEGGTVGKVVRDFKRALPEAEIYVYDNNSTDNTAEEAKTAGAVVRREYRQGKGNVMRSMFRDIDADCYIMADGDDTYPAEEAGKLAEAVLTGRADMVIGDRLSSTYYQVNKRPMHNMGNRLVCRVINFLFRSHVRDIMTGYRAFSWEFVKSFPVLSRGFEIETEMSIHTLDKNFRILELPVKYRDRPEGSDSKLHTVTDGIRVLRTIVTLFKEYRPMEFFGALSVICMLVSVYLFVPVLLEYFETHIVPRFPTLIVSGFLMVSGLLLLSCGIILDVVGKKHRQLFELYLNMLRQKRTEI